MVRGSHDPASLCSLPDDAIACVCCHCNIRDVEHLHSTCREIYASREYVYEWVAYARWGAEFWKRAFARKYTPHPFRGFRREVCTIAAFEQQLANHGLMPWTNVEYFAFWDYWDRANGKEGGDERRE